MFRNSGVQCFFCNSFLDKAPRDPRNFLCPHCTCWNRYDQYGEISSYEAAMQDESLNRKSYLRRGSPRKDRLPTTYSATPDRFCRTCSTNQTLIMNLLSNYLPPPESSEYDRRSVMLPEYQKSLERRYPPVCSNCQLIVDEQIKKSDQMARSQALGGWLKRSKSKATGTISSDASDIPASSHRPGRDIIAWRLRGLLWFVTLALSLWINHAGAFGSRPFNPMMVPGTFYPIFIFVSLLWTAWDPTYEILRRAQIQGRNLRIRGKQKYIIFQLSAWLSRLVTSILFALATWDADASYIGFTAFDGSQRSHVYFYVSLAIELLAFVGSCSVLRVTRPPKIRLLDGGASKASEGADVQEKKAGSRGTKAASQEPLDPLQPPDLFSLLSLSSKPVISPESKPSPVFGVPSLGKAQTPPPPGKDENAMDWTPTDGDASRRNARSEDQHDISSWIRRQHFFAPEKPTGLESLFEGTRLVDDVKMQDATKETRFGWRRYTNMGLESMASPEVTTFTEAVY
ncbi:hypothetical protein FISHEDRAFT_66817 [Fistulina hepatica ATCC 64428]|uniref:Ima1 N-terminal domain-containing protein n=1 Tax=Fistulina hepatica ATCC 64428 TaxID=1128425 RepID=A0A0D7A4V4_9AGAR|nr:hypothetical protein FISHEDRAFT_66817 [Fistulina hepatica ATCC 64428]